MELGHIHAQWQQKNSIQGINKESPVTTVCAYSKEPKPRMQCGELWCYSRFSKSSWPCRFRPHALQDGSCQSGRVGDISGDLTVAEVEPGPGKTVVSLLCLL